MSYCTHCGTPRSDSDKFCGACGAELAVVGETPIPRAVTPVAPIENQVPVDQASPRSESPRQSTLAKEDSNQEVPSGGVGRLGYFLSSLVLNAAFIGFSGDYSVADASSGILFLAWLVPALGQVWLAQERSENIGWTGGYAFLMLIPIVATFANMFFMALPGGYARTQRLDTTAIVVFVVFGLFLALIVAAVAIPALVG
jgi:uncharacterized membrane protein YhaH (DUF805 family)